MPGLQNPADCASGELFPFQLKSHDLWWNGPEWLKQDLSAWPEQPCLSMKGDLAEERTACNVVIVDATQPVLDVSHYSTFTRLKRVTAWILRFVGNLRNPVSEGSKALSFTVTELSHAENYWLQVAQGESFPEEVSSLKNGRVLSKCSRLLPFRPIWDKDRGILRVGGRISNSQLIYSQAHRVILDGKHALTKLIVQYEHLRLKHAGPTLLQSTLNERFHIIGARKTVRFVTRRCIVCRHHTVQPQDQLLGQLPAE